MKVYRPLQLGFNHRVLEQNRKFYFIATATLGVHLQTGKPLLEFDYLKDAFEAMGEDPQPDEGMPKPAGEFLVSGSFYSAGGRPVPGGEVSVSLGGKEKRLYVFGPRKWSMGAPSDHQSVTTVPVDYKHAFGGPDYEKNPLGMGLDDGLLPCVEHPSNLVASPGDRPEPAGFGPLSPAWPQRRKFQGTYGDDYKQKYFPGYPEDTSWKYFLAAPRDQWMKGYFEGNEPYSITNMHPEEPVISGTLPGFAARCFIRRAVSGGQAPVEELDMNLDTVWFFPDKLLALLIWRKGIEVADDEADDITHVLAAFEDARQPPKTPEHYKQAMDLRINSDDDLLHNLKTSDLIPAGVLTAMQLLQELALSEAKESELEKNIDAKVDGINKMVDEKMEEAIRETEKNIAEQDLPEGAADQIPESLKEYVSDDGKVDIRKLLEQKKEAEPDLDLEEYNKKLEAIIPGITSGDPTKIDLKEFSFDDIDKIMDASEELADKKQAQAMEMIKTEMAATRERIKEALDGNAEAMAAIPDEEKAKMEENLKALEELDLEKNEPSPLTRVDVEEIMAEMEPMSPALMEAGQHLDAARAAGLPEETRAEFEKQIKEAQEERMKEIEDMLRDAQKAFKETYIMVAHFMEDGLSPHKDPVDVMANKLLAAIAAGDDVSNRDWACLDLSGKNFDGLNLSGCFLEQVNLRGASLKGADLRGAIMARADLTDADFTGANLEGTNLGAVKAVETDFSKANMKEVVISFGDFQGAVFSEARLEDVESLDIKVDEADFSRAVMPDMRFIEADISKAKFTETDLSSVLFYDCAIKDADFSRAILKGSSFANARLENVRFDGADMSGACFVGTDPDKSAMINLSFKESLLKQANFQGMVMNGADLTGADLKSANFLESDLTEANLAMARAKGAMFRKARLTDAKLNSIDLMEACLAKAYLVRASFVNANLYSADFLRSTITNTDFTGANLDNTIIEDWRPR